MRLGIFGGTFDPIHNVHLFVAESARIMEQLDRVLFVPTNNAYYRSKPQATAEHRCAMVLGAIDSNPYFTLDEEDLRSDATGYTADLIPRIKKKHPHDSLTFITGADSLANNTWMRFEEVLQSLDSFLIAPRTGTSGEAISRVLAAVEPSLRSRVKTLHLPELPESATLIRTLLSQGRSVRYLVPDAVWNYIVTQKLYGFAAS